MRHRTTLIERRLQDLMPARSASLGLSIVGIALAVLAITTGLRMLPDLIRYLKIKPM